MIKQVTALLLVLGTAAVADAPVIQGGYAFDAMHPKKSKCAKVDGALLKKLSAKTFTCAKPETESASGKPIVAECKTKKEDTLFMVMKTVEDCKEERETQLANGA